VLLCSAAAVVGVVPWSGTTAHAAIVPTVQLATAAEYAVLGGSTVTNTGPSVLDGSAGVSPGTAVTGFPPGIVLPPATIHAADAPAAAAQADLTTAYVDAAGRPVDGTTTADLGGLVLVGGVYAGPSRSPLTLTGPLVLDGANDPTSVFIFQTDSTLITASGSTVTLINGAQECNVFWQVGSSATLGTGSTFTGTILALTSVTVTSGVTVRGRALARNGAVTLDGDVFTRPGCAAGAQPSPAGTPGGSSATTSPGGTPVGATTPGGTVVDATSVPPGTDPGAPGDTLPRTGPAAGITAIPAGVVLAAGIAALLLARRRAGPAAG